MTGGAGISGCTEKAAGSGSEVGIGFSAAIILLVGTDPFANITTPLTAGGILNQKQLPLPSSESTPILPPCASIKPREIDRPNPTPLTEWRSAPLLTR